LGAKPQPNQVDPCHWFYEIVENGDGSVDGNVRDMMALFRGPRATLRRPG